MSVRYKKMGMVPPPTSVPIIFQLPTSSSPRLNALSSPTLIANSNNANNINNINLLNTPVVGPSNPVESVEVVLDGQDPMLVGGLDIDGVAAPVSVSATSSLSLSLSNANSKPTSNSYYVKVPIGAHSLSFRTEAKKTLNKSFKEMAKNQNNPNDPNPSASFKYNTMNNSNNNIIVSNNVNNSTMSSVELSYYKQKNEEKKMLNDSDNETQLLVKKNNNNNNSGILAKNNMNNNNQSEGESDVDTIVRLHYDPDSLENKQSDGENSPSSDGDKDKDDGDGDGTSSDDKHLSSSSAGVLANGWKHYLKVSLSAVFLESKMNILLIAIPFAVASYYAKWGDAPTFVLSLIALCPLAERISFVTDEICKHTNQTIAGLLSATMGNITELIVSIVALAKGLLVVVQLSLLGSIISNLLLVLGTAFLYGGAYHSTQNYSQSAAVTNTGLLLLSIMGLMFPMILIQTDTNNHQLQENGALLLSRITSVCLLFVYICLIVYQLKTHSHLFEEQEENEEDDEEPPVLGFAGAIFWAFMVTFAIGVLSEFIVDAIEGAARSMGIPILFISTILLPIVGNAAEHASAVIFARRNQMDISLGIAVGSATQISLFVIPLTVIVGWWISQPLTLDYGVFETAVLFVTVIMVSVGLHTGTSDWLKGVLLLMGYAIIAASFWISPTPQELIDEGA